MDRRLVARDAGGAERLQAHDISAGIALLEVAAEAGHGAVSALEAVGGVAIVVES